MSKQKPEQRHHYIPAAYLGRFSWIATGRPRRRPVYVAHVDVQETFYNSAENLACKEGLYNLSESDWLGKHIDVWDYESRLPSALDELRDSGSSMSADTWLHTLVPFVTGLFVRGPDRNEGENNFGRIVEFQELLAPVMAARWTVVHLPAEAELITSDRGFGGVTLSGRVGVMVPCDSRTALVLTACDKRTIARWTDGRWVTDISHVQADASIARLFRESVSRSAHTATYGSSKDLVAEFQDRLATIAEYPEGIITERVCDLQCHTYDYFRACSAISVDPSNAQGLAEKISWDAFPGQWEIPIIIQCLFPERTRGGINVEGDSLILDLNFGISVMKIRRELKDFRRGAMTAIPIAHVIQHVPELGKQWKTGRAGEAGHTYMNLSVTGPEVEINLGLLRSDLGLDSEG